MKLRTSEIVSLLFALLVVFSASALAIVSPRQNQQTDAKHQFQNDNRKPPLNVNTSSDAAKASEPAAQAIAARVQNQLSSSFETSLRENIDPNNVVFTCDAVSSFQDFAKEAVSHSMKTQSAWVGGDGAATEQFVSETQKQFNRFIHLQLEGGEKLKSGKVLITSESFNATRLRFCPLIPIC